MQKTPDSTAVTVDPHGRLVIPSEIRERIGIKVGDTLLAMVENGRLVFEKPESVLERLRRRFENIPAGTSLTDELIAERRAEFHAEDEP